MLTFALAHAVSAELGAVTDVPSRLSSPRVKLNASQQTTFGCDGQSRTPDQQVCPSTSACWSGVFAVPLTARLRPVINECRTARTPGAVAPARNGRLPVESLRLIK